MQLLTKKIRAKLPPLGATQEQDLKETIAWVKFFTPDGGWTWYAAEFDGHDIFWGLVFGIEKEFGTFSLTELQSLRGALGLPVERDRFYSPQSLEELNEKDYPQ